MVFLVLSQGVEWVIFFRLNDRFYFLRFCVFSLGGLSDYSPALMIVGIHVKLVHLAADSSILILKYILRYRNIYSYTLPSIKYENLNKITTIFLLPLQAELVDQQLNFWVLDYDLPINSG